MIYDMCALLPEFSDWIKFYIENVLKSLSHKDVVEIVDFVCYLFNLKLIILSVKKYFFVS